MGAQAERIGSTERVGVVIAGNHANWFKLSTGPRKGERVFVNNATLDNSVLGNSSKDAIHRQLAKGNTNANKYIQQAAAKSPQPANQAKTGSHMLSLAGYPSRQHAANDARRARENFAERKQIIAMMNSPESLVTKAKGGYKVAHINGVTTVGTAKTHKAATDLAQKHLEDQLNLNSAERQKVLKGLHQLPDSMIASLGGVT